MSAASPPPVAAPNIVLVLVDTLRADRLGVYGYSKPTSPHIDALAAEGVVFERCDAPASRTLPPVVSMLTSAFPCEHGVLVDGQKINAETEPLAAGRLIRLSLGPLWDRPGRSCAQV